ncbi:MAG TPA: serine hydrolase [Burkholderiales bacterium]|jgi:CubicO group peptidase (beta-lactamase class C family)|nr:serine hydrolase [Burkholderiales bacterium]
MQKLLMILFALWVPAAVCGAQQRSLPPEYPSAWEVPPGDPVEHMTAGFAKVLCSALFITGRDLQTATDEDGFFVSPRAERSLVTKTVVDEKARAVHLTLPNGVTRSARLVPDQGCVTLPRGMDSVFFTPAKVRSALPDGAAQPWPMGDRLPGTPPAPEVDAAKVRESVQAAFDPAEALTAAFVVAYKGRIIAERYQHGLDHTTRLPSWSMGKSIVATLMGQLVHQGVYDLWTPAPVDEWQRPDDPRRAIRIADLLRMSSGLRFLAPQDPDYDPARGYPDHLYIYTGAIDSIRWAVTRPAQWPPNTVGRYRNSDPLVVNYLIRKAVLARKQEYLSYPQQHLFDRLGIRNLLVEADPYGNLAFQGYDLGTGRDWLRLGLLYLQDGVWNGERLLPEGWADFVRTPAPAWSKPVYGAFFWLNRTRRWPVPEDAYFMAGAGGQYTIIIPTHDLVVVRLGHYKGAAAGEKSLARALELLMDAVPQVRDSWQPPPGGR